MIALVALLLYCCSSHCSLATLLDAGGAAESLLACKLSTLSATKS